MTDPLTQVAALPGVTDAVAEARATVDRLLGHRVLRRRSAEVSTEAALRGARATASLEGVKVTLEDLRGDGTVDPVVQGALRVTAELGALTDTWRRAPRQVLARLHVLATAPSSEGTEGAAIGDMVLAGELGRPRIEGQTVSDPLNLGPAPSPAEVAARLDMLSDLVTRPSEAPAIVLAAVVHGELMALRPFGRGDGMVARAAQRLTLVERGVDPKSLIAPEVGHAELADDYAAALRGYIIGTPDGVSRWIAHCADAIGSAARDSLAICEALLRG